MSINKLHVSKTHHVSEIHWATSAIHMVSLTSVIETTDELCSGDGSLFLSIVFMTLIIFRNFCIGYVVIEALQLCQ